MCLQALKSIQIIPSFSGYGADRLVLDLHNMFLRKGADSYIISLTGDCPSGVNFIYSLGLNNPYHPKTPLRLAYKLKEIQRGLPTAGIVHAHLTPCQLMAPLAVKLSGSNYGLITTEHSTNNRRRNMILGKFLDSQLFKFYHRVICISDAVEEAMTVWQPSLKNRLITIPNGIDLNRYMGNTMSYHRESRPVIISVGRLHRLKNYKAAIEACALLNDVDFEYHILGAGEEEPELRQLIMKIGIEEKIKLLGFQPNVTKYLNKSHIFLMVSLWEGFGLSAVEAMASGLPVVVSDVPGVREVVGTDEDCGLLIDPKNPSNIAEKLRRLILNPELRTIMGVRAKLKAKLYSIERTADEYLKLYRAQLSSHACRI